MRTSRHSGKVLCNSPHAANNSCPTSLKTKSPSPGKLTMETNSVKSQKSIDTKNGISMYLEDKPTNDSLNNTNYKNDGESFFIGDQDLIKPTLIANTTTHTVDKESTKRQLHQVSLGRSNKYRSYKNRSGIVSTIQEQASNITVKVSTLKFLQ